MLLDAGPSTDPDGHALDFHWSVYPLSPEAARDVAIEGRDTAQARVRVGPALSGERVPILMSVTDRGSPALTRYARVILTVE